MPNLPQNALPWHRREDTWAIVIALGLVLAVSGAFFLGASRAVAAAALAIPTWSGDLGAVASALRAQPAALAAARTTVTAARLA